MNITVVGAGNVGCALAADQALKGHNLTLLKTTRLVHEENFENIYQNKGLLFVKDGKECFAKLHLITRDFEKAISNADIIIITTQTLSHENLCNQMSSYLKDGQILLFEPGYGGSLIFALKNKDKKLIYAEATSSPIDCRITGLGKVNILFENVKNHIGFFPSGKKDYGMSVISKLYDNFIVLENVLEAALHNPNLIVHTVGAIMNAGRIEYSKGEFWMYKEGFPPSVWSILIALDEERKKVLQKVGLQPIGYLDMVKVRLSEDVSKNKKEIFDFYCREGSPKGPMNIQTRYITEDVPIGLCFMSSLANKIGLKVPICDSLINIASAIHGVDYFSIGRTVENLGLYDYSVEEILDILKNGF